MVDDPNRVLGSAEQCGNCGQVLFIPREYRNKAAWTRSTFKCEKCLKPLTKQTDQWLDPDF